MSLKSSSYVDSEGRHVEVLLPEEVPDGEAEKGVRVGPPSLEALELPQELEVRLHNELFHRKIFTPKDALRRRNDIMSALQSALKVDVDRIVVQYIGEDYKNATTQSTKDKPDPPVHDRRPRQPRQRRQLSVPGSRPRA